MVPIGPETENYGTGSSGKDDEDYDMSEYDEDDDEEEKWTFSEFQDGKNRWHYEQKMVAVNIAIIEDPLIGSFFDIFHFGPDRQAKGVFRLRRTVKDFSFNEIEGKNTGRTAEKT